MSYAGLWMDVYRIPILTGGQTKRYIFRGKISNISDFMKNRLEPRILQGLKDTFFHQHESHPTVSRLEQGMFLGKVLVGHELKRPCRLEMFFIPVLYHGQVLTTLHHVGTTDDVFIGIDKHLELLGFEDDIRIDPHNVGIVYFTIEGFLILTTKDVPSEAHGTDVVDDGGFFTGHGKGNIFPYAVYQKVCPTIQEGSREVGSWQAENDFHAMLFKKYAA